jgi:hypothetical protein
VKANRPGTLAEAVTDAILARQADPEAYRPSEAERARLDRERLAAHFRESNERTARLTAPPQPANRVHPFGSAPGPGTVTWPLP